MCMMFDIQGLYKYGENKNKTKKPISIHTHINQSIKITNSHNCGKWNKDKEKKKCDNK